MSVGLTIPAAPMMIDAASMRKKYFTNSPLPNRDNPEWDKLSGVRHNSYVPLLVLIRLVRSDDAYVMIRKFEVRSRQFHFGHMTGCAILCSHPARRRRSLGVRFYGGPRRVPAGGMAGHALRVVVSRVLIERFVRVVAGGAAYAAVIRITLAVKNPVGLETDVVHSHPFERGELACAAVTGGAEILRQFVAAEPRGVEDQFGVRLSRLARGHVVSAGAMTGFALDAERQFVEMEIGAAYSPCRMAAETAQRFTL